MIIEPLTIFIIIYLAIASYFDLKTREIPDYVNYSAFAIGFLYKSYSAIINQNHYFLTFPLILSLIIFGFGYLMYLIGGWGGGDTKLLTSCAMLFGWNKNNPSIFISFLVALFIFVFLWSISYALTIGIIKYDKIKEKINKIKFFTLLISGIAFHLIMHNTIMLLLFLLLSLLEPIKVIQDNCFVKEIKAKELTLGDWVVKKVKIGKYELKPKKTGADKEDLKNAKNSNKKILIKEGVPLSPAFLFAYLTIIFKQKIITTILQMLITI